MLAAYACAAFFVMKGPLSSCVKYLQRESDLLTIDQHTRRNVLFRSEMHKNNSITPCFDNGSANIQPTISRFVIIKLPISRPDKQCVMKFDLSDWLLRAAKPLE